MMVVAALWADTLHVPISRVKGSKQQKHDIKKKLADAGCGIDAMLHGADDDERAALHAFVENLSSVTGRKKLVREFNAHMEDVANEEDDAACDMKDLCTEVHMQEVFFVFCLHRRPVHCFTLHRVEEILGIHSLAECVFLLLAS